MKVILKDEDFVWEDFDSIFNDRSNKTNTNKNFYKENEKVR